MTTPVLVPPIKCQGIKTKLVTEIAALAGKLPRGRWVEPFCGSCAVALNVQPKKALLCDTNVHIIQFYKDIQTQRVTPATVREFLEREGDALRKGGDEYYYSVRDRFNSSPNSHDFLFLNRSCFNGVMRFNQSGKFNVPFCRKPQRFSRAYITKIVNQVRSISKVLAVAEWEFRASDFRETLATVGESDFVYADPPYAGRHVDYFNRWSDKDEQALTAHLSTLPCRFLLSTWHSNQFRTNDQVEQNWSSPKYHIFLQSHYYHVGASEDNRHEMLEALVTNYPHEYPVEPTSLRQQPLFIEQRRENYDVSGKPIGVE